MAEEICDTVVIDNGGGFARFGFAGQHGPEHTIPNCIAVSKKLGSLQIGDETLSNQDFSQLHYTRPFEKGYLVDCEVESVSSELFFLIIFVIFYIL